MPRRRHRHVRKNFTVYGNQSTFALSQIYIANLVSLELVSGNFPRGQYLVDRGNSWLDVVVGGAPQSVQVQLGSAVTSVTLAAELTALVAGLTFAYDVGTAAYTVTGTAEFALLFRTGEHRDDSLCRELGFACDTDYRSAPAGPFVVVSPYRADLSGARFLHLVTAELDEKLDRGLLAQVPLIPPHAYAVYNPGTITRRFFEPFPLRSLTVTLNEYDASKKLLRPYDFRGLYWCLVLEAVVREFEFPVDPCPAPSSVVLNQIYWTGGTADSGAAGVVVHR